MGFMAGRKISNFLELMTKNKTFAELDIPLLVVATDLITGETVVIEEGSVAQAIRASISIPGVFRPVRDGERVLVDGAVTDRLPVRVAQEWGADIIIAVDVTFCGGKKIVIRNTLDVIMTSLDILQKQQFDSVSPLADILIQPAVGGYSPQDFEHSRELVELGRIATLDKIEDIKKTIKQWEETHS
jgi:NTE family protein